MTTEQFTQLLIILQKIADKSYTLTGAADWPMLVAMGGMLVLLIGCMWADLRGKFAANDQEHNRLWRAHMDCQDECCPRRVDSGLRRRSTDTED